MLPNEGKGLVLASHDFSCLEKYIHIDWQGGCDFEYLGNTLLEYSLADPWAKVLLRLEALMDPQVAIRGESAMKQQDTLKWETSPQYAHYMPLLFIAGLPTQFSPGLSSNISSCTSPNYQEKWLRKMIPKYTKMTQWPSKSAGATRLGNLPVSSLYMTWACLRFVQAAPPATQWKMIKWSKCLFLASSSRFASDSVPKCSVSAEPRATPME